MPVFKRTLERSYYTKGFFYVTTEYDRFVRPTPGPVKLVLGRSGERIQARVDRSAHLKGRARIIGGAKLRDYLQSNYRFGDVIDVDLRSFSVIRID